MNIFQKHSCKLDEMNSSIHDGSCKSYRSSLTKQSLDNYKRDLENEMSILSVDNVTAPTWDSQTLGLSISSGDEEATTQLSHLVQAIEKCAKKLQEDPIPSEKTCIALMQSLWNITRAFKSSIRCGPAQTASFVSSLAVDMGALIALTNVMRAYKESSRVQSRGVLLLGALSEDNVKYQDAVADNHGVSYILAALVNHSQSSSLCIDACKSLTSVTSLSIRNLSMMVHGDGVKTVRSVMQIHAKEEELQKCALLLLSNVAKIDFSRKSHDASTTCNPYQLLEHVEDPELIETMVECINKNKRSRAVLKQGGILIHILATQGKPRTRCSLVWSKVVPIIVKISKSFVSNAITQTECIETLICLCNERPEARDVVAEDGCAFLFDAMVMHPKDSMVQTSACRLLHLICCFNHTCAPVAKCFKKHAKYRKTLEEAEKRYSESCKDMVGEIINYISSI